MLKSIKEFINKSLEAIRVWLNLHKFKIFTYGGTLLVGALLGGIFK